MILGLKLLTKDGESLNSWYTRVKYPAVGSWIGVPGNGAYVARTGGLTSGGYGPVLAVIECDENTRKAASAPGGVECFGRVRRVPELEAKLIPCQPKISTAVNVKTIFFMRFLLYWPSHGAVLVLN